MKTFGLIGKNIDYSFSRSYFSKKFEAENIPAVYLNFDLPNIEEIEKVLVNYPGIAGFNVTIPYKEEIIPFLDELDITAEEIGAVNTIKICEGGKLKGYNTDYYGFAEALKPKLKQHHTGAIILGTGGASKAVAYALKQFGIDYKFVSRTASQEQLNYKDLNKTHIDKYKLVINCTPLGTFPNISDYPGIPTKFLTEDNLVFDLIYNPPVTQLMKLAALQGATVMNGQRMLELQAEKAWEIWNK